MAKTMNDVLSYIKSVRKKIILIPKNSKDKPSNEIRDSHEIESDGWIHILVFNINN